MGDERIKVLGTSCIIKLIAGSTDGMGAGLILHGEDQCYDLAEQLINAGDRIAYNRKGPIPDVLPFRVCGKSKR